NYSVTVTNAYGSATSSNAALTVNIPPSITTQPASQTVPVAGSATFNVVATGDPTLNYQWRFNGTNLSGATTTSLNVTNVQLANEGNYSVVVTNPFASITSSNAALAVNTAGCSPPPSGLVSWWPGNGNAGDLVGGNTGTLQGSVTYVNGEVGQAFSFTTNGQGVVVGNPVSLRLQTFTIECWARRASTSLVNSSGQDGLLFGYGSGGYAFGLSHVNGDLLLSRVDVSNVTIGSGPADTNWHHVAVTASGGTVIFYIDGVAYAAPAYAPGYTFGTSAAIGARGDNLTGAFDGAIDELAVYSRALAASEIQAIYNAGSAGKCGAGSPPAITTQPASQAVTEGSNAMFNVVATGIPPFSYQWQFSGTNLNGATGSALTLIGVQPVNAGNYSVAVANIYGSTTSSNASLTVNTPPAIASQPANQSVAAGSSAQFSAGAGGTPPFTYQWRFNGNNLTDGGNISGSATTNLTVGNVSAADVGTYSLMISNLFGSALSSNAMLTIIPAYELSATTAGGGGVTANPFLTQYPSNSTVTLIATPAGGWTFLNWLDDAQGSNPSFDLIMNSSKKAVARFGTGLNTAVFGGGAITVNPSMTLYPYGQSVRLVAQPQAGSYFVRWTNGAAGVNNPLTLSIQNNNVTVGAIFAPLTNGSFSLTVLAAGFGTTSAAPPGKSVFTNGATVTLTAAPGSGQTFLGWSGTVSATNNPLVVTMNQNQIITANFTVRPLLTVQPASDLQGILLTLNGGSTSTYSIQKSGDLVTWTNWQTVTNIYGESQLVDQFGTNNWFFYRAMGQ
ncbi:MAG TPA: immunoglobulin domain-containing protein, partial [Verrucomicrobiae bacterium]|nr:immunoglobulin domain-containing protein [Verrucomicrobiae bacterium]